jgi:hypothetical protein
MKLNTDECEGEHIKKSISKKFSTFTAADEKLQENSLCCVVSSFEYFIVFFYHDTKPFRSRRRKKGETKKQKG